MRLDVSQVPAERAGGEGGRVHAALVVALGVLLLGVGWWLGYRAGQQATLRVVGASAGAARTAIEPGRLEPAPMQPGGELENLRVPIAAAPAPVVGGSVPQATAQAPPGRVLEDGPKGLRGGSMGALEGGLGLGGRLGRGGDPAERLALTKEILQENPASGQAIQALNVLFELEPETARAQLFALLGSEDPAAQAPAAAAIWSAGRHEGALSAEDFAAAYELGDRDVRIAAAATLEGRGDDSLARRYEAECAAELASTDAEVRARAVHDLAQRRSETSVTLLLPLLSDKSEEVRLEVLRSLQFASSDPRLLEALRPLRQDPSERVSSMASRIVQSLERGRDRGGLGMRER